jgi:arsenite oxidase small subunit
MATGRVKGRLLMLLKTVKVSRRSFLIATAGAGAGAAVLIVGCGEDGEPDVVSLSYTRTRLAALDDLSPGEPFTFAYPGEGQSNFLLKLGAPAVGGVGPDEDIVAFSYLCTHMGCPLIGVYNDEHKIMGPCPCHFTTFDLRQNGMVVLGQATQNLPQIALDIEDGDVYATGVAGLFYGSASNLQDAARAEAAS